MKLQVVDLKTRGWKWDRSGINKPTRLVLDKVWSEVWSDRVSAVYGISDRFGRLNDGDRH